MLDHLDDLASDFSAVHRVDDILALDGPTFFRLASRIGCYQGVMRDLVMAQAAEERAERAPASQQPAWPGNGQRQVVGGTRAELQMAPEFAGIFSFATAG